MRLGLQVFLLLAFAFSSLIARAEPPPIAPALAVAPEGDLRALVKKDWVTYFAEFKARQDFDGLRFRSVMVGPYFNYWDHLRLGIFYQQQTGWRYETDWEKVDGVWRWDQANGRTEHMLVLDVTPRTELAFMPGEWLAELKLRYRFSSLNHQQTLVARPGLTYAWKRDDATLLDLFLQAEFYFQMNFGLSDLAETWLYLGALHPVSQAFQFGGFGALRSAHWETPGNNVTIAQSFVLGVFGVFQLDLGE
jgi:hypothetical protein